MEKPLSTPYLKPVPEMSIYSHLMRLANHCQAMGDRDNVKKRKDYYHKAAEQLRKIANGRAVSGLNYYGE